MSKPVLGKSILSVVVALLAVAGASAGAQTGDIKERTIKMPVVNAIDHPQGIGAKKSMRRASCCRRSDSVRFHRA